MTTTNQIAPPITAPPIVVIDDFTVKLGGWTVTVTPTNHPIPDAFDYNIEDEHEELVNWYYGFIGNPGKPTGEPLSEVWSEALTVAREEWIERETNRIAQANAIEKHLAALPDYPAPAVVLVNADSGLIELAKQTIAQNALARALGDKLCAIVRECQADLLDLQLNLDRSGDLPDEAKYALADLCIALIDEVARDADSTRAQYEHVATALTVQASA